MPTYEKSQIVPGLYMTLDATGVGPAYVKRSQPPRPVRYGDPAPDFSELNKNLDQVKARLEKLRADLRAARVRK